MAARNARILSSTPELKERKETNDLTPPSCNATVGSRVRKGSSIKWQGYTYLTKS